MTGELIVSNDDAPSEAEKSGTGIHSIEDQGDKWLIHTYHLSMAGASSDYIVDKKTGDVTSRYPLTGDETSAHNLFQTIK